MEALGRLYPFQVVYNTLFQQTCIHSLQTSIDEITQQVEAILLLPV